MARPQPTPPQQMQTPQRTAKKLTWQDVNGPHPVDKAPETVSPSKWDLFPVFELEETYGPQPLLSDGASAPAPVFHSNTQLEGYTTILPDCGAVENLTGADAIEAAIIDREQQGITAEWRQLDRPKPVGGVGGQSEKCTHIVSLPSRLENGLCLNYNAPVISGSPSPVPSLFGRRPMAAMNIYMGMRSGEMACVPDGLETEIQWPPGTTFMDCREAPSGHLVLVTNAWNAAQLPRHPGGRRQR